MSEAERFIRKYETTKGAVFSKEMVIEIMQDFADEQNKELRKRLVDLAAFCEYRNELQSDGNEFAPSFIKRIRNLNQKP